MAGRRAGLAPGLLELSRVKDANVHEPTAGAVRSVEWHPSGALMLAAGLDKRLRFFAVDGVRNAAVQTVVLDDMPIWKAQFANGGSQVRCILTLKPEKLTRKVCCLKLYNWWLLGPGLGKLNISKLIHGVFQVQNSVA